MDKSSAACSMVVVEDTRMAGKEAVVGTRKVVEAVVGKRKVVEVVGTVGTDKADEGTAAASVAVDRDLQGRSAVDLEYCPRKEPAGS